MARSRLIAGQRIARQCARNAAHGTAPTAFSVVLLFESRMTTPVSVGPISTQFFPGVHRLDLSQSRWTTVSRTSAAMAVPPNDVVDVGIILRPDYSGSKAAEILTVDT